MAEKNNHEHEHHHAHAPQQSKIEQALSKYNCDINDADVAAAVKKIIAEKVPENDNNSEDNRLRRECFGIYRARKPVRFRLPCPPPRSYNLRLSLLCKGCKRIFGSRWCRGSMC